MNAMQKNQPVSAYVDPRRYTIILVLCFFGIAALEIVAYVINDRIVSRQQAVAHFAQLGNRQRALSLNIALLAQEYAASTDAQVRAAKRTRIETLAQDMNRNHVLMTEGDPASGMPMPDSAEIDQIIFGNPIFLDETLRRFLFAVNEITSQPWAADLENSHSMSEISGLAAGALSTGIERLVDAMEDDGRSKVESLELALVATSGIMVAIIGGLVVFVILPIMRRIADQTKELIDLARTDPLTGCHNRRSFLRESESEFNRFRRYGADMSVIMLDIDNFKKINDTYGHAAGDEVIRRLAQICIDNIRKSDVLGRLGGEEFAILMPETSAENAQIAAEKLRTALEDTPVAFNGHDITFTVSLGLTLASPDDEEMFQVVNRADEALYRAKNGGRNQVAVKLAGDAAPYDRLDSAGATRSSEKGDA